MGEERFEKEIYVSFGSGFGVVQGFRIVRDKYGLEGCGGIGLIGYQFDEFFVIYRGLE